MLRHRIKENRGSWDRIKIRVRTPAKNPLHVCHFPRLNLTSYKITYGFLYEAGKLGTHFLFLKKEIRKEKFWFKCLDCIMDGLTERGKSFL